MMIRTLASAGFVSLALSAPTFAASVFFDDFSGDAPGLNTTLTNFDVTGQIDVKGAVNAFGIVTPGGSVVDLDGSTGPGRITSKASYGFSAGDRVTLTMLIGGSQRVDGTDDLVAGFTFDDATSVKDYFGTGYLSFGPDTYDFQVSGLGTAGFTIDDEDPFAMTTLSFTALSPGTLKFFVGTFSADSIGPLVASVDLDVAPVPLPAAGSALLLGLGLLAAVRRKRN